MVNLALNTALLSHGLWLIEQAEPHNYMALCQMDRQMEDQFVGELLLFGFKALVLKNQGYRIAVPDEFSRLDAACYLTGLALIGLADMGLLQLEVRDGFIRWMKPSEFNKWLSIFTAIEFPSGFELCRFPISDLQDAATFSLYLAQTA